MKYMDKVLSKTEIENIKKEFGNYVKITADLENKKIIVGCELHADGEKILLEKGGKQDNIWGGGLNLEDKIIDTTAVLNIRSRLGNDSMEILDSTRREKFVSIVKEYFEKLWH
ncbi:MAG: hypothetical protein UU16_C0015G0003 [Candidatus Woesebacteria bacterium GW2011_GWA2_40_7]|uniref:Uncharacterized protein n=3 Tax=Candidatus Woeseibacteriota TaxID=1752722 RepID=A0A0G0LJ24_9BACT|nr:MAG: hypothetical protein UT17_C0004G0256 [Candidatus Woesebacteria bacterium GW2011_GWB1_39_10]KKR73707.1 MAG: hypothetical protein UU16_C0015G0003 [Candidatus Woesebacteria bacterium GW2011_GWA2_40_7]